MPERDARRAPALAMELTRPWSVLPSALNDQFGHEHICIGFESNIPAFREWQFMLTKNS